MELEKAFNKVKHQEEFGMVYVTEVSKFVAQGACLDFRRAYENWRNPELRAGRPSFKKKNRCGAGSFLAASGVSRMRYDGHRRIGLPYLGSVKPRARTAGGYPLRGEGQKAKWAMVRQHQLLEAACRRRRQDPRLRCCGRRH